MTRQQKYASAIVAFQKALELDPNQYAAAWKLSRTYIRMGELQSDPAQKLDLFRKGADCARKATEINSNDSRAFLELSIALGRITQYVDVKEALQLSRETKKAVDKALELDPDDDGAWQVLGQWHRRLGSVGGMERQFANLFLGGIPPEASVDEAIECFKKAIELHPKYGGHYLELAATYAKLNRREDAIQAYQKVLELPVTGANGQRFRETAQTALDKMRV